MNFNEIFYGQLDTPKSSKTESCFFYARKQKPSLEAETMKVEPITEVKHIRSIKKLLAENPRDKLLFIMGINSGMRVQDLLQFRVKDVCHKAIGDRITLVEMKTGKENVLIINQEIYDAIKAYLACDEHDESHFLFKSRKGRNYPLTTFRVMKLIKSWTEALNIQGNFGAHTLRKTWCYMQRKEFGVSWEVIAKRLNHSNPAITRRYLGIKEEEVEEALLNNI
jgi:integrase